MATKFDRESFNLLKMTDSGSESVPDLTFEISHQSRNKKKVRLKRWATGHIFGHWFFIERKGIKLCTYLNNNMSGGRGRQEAV